MGFLNFNIEFEDLYKRDGLGKIDHLFLNFLNEKDRNLYDILINLRDKKSEFSTKDYSKYLVDIAPIVDDFISLLFDIEKENNSLKNHHILLANLYSVKRLFVQRKAARKKLPDNFNHEEAKAELTNLLDGEFSELNLANKISLWLENADQYTKELELAENYASFALNSEIGRNIHKNSILFKQPKKIDNQQLIDLDHIETHERNGFDLTDKGISLEMALDQSAYCIFCHNQDKDSCSHGLRDKETNSFKKNELSVNLTGCPLEEKISESNNTKSLGYSIGALAIITIDNPILAATGHRICNDCMKSCIYQKQEPVNIPIIESKTFEDVLSLPYGFEIYSLLTRWNPLKIENYIPKDETKYKILVSGLGPAGFTLSHYLLNEGHKVIAIDGLKIEPVDPELSGIDIFGKRQKFKPIKDINNLFDRLSERTPQGFGGVMEYGITVRWNKNYLTLIRLLLERRENFQMFGGIRFGSNIDYKQANELGFDHIAICHGAGSPNLVEIPQFLARGVRTASDFLMSLQLSGAFRKDSLSNLQVRLPAIIIGGGLTAIDTATEVMAYYPVQVEKFFARYEELEKHYGKEFIDSLFTEEEKIIANEFIEHAKIYRESKENKSLITKKLGGAKIVYRKKLQDSPAYRLNHEEVELALSEGIEFLEELLPLKIDVDEFDAVKSITCKYYDQEKILSAQSIFIAAGTNPNTILAKEDSDNFVLDGRYFKAIDENGEIVHPERIAKPDETYVLTSIDENSKAISFFGDMHPSYQGNVVKAMASAKNGYKIISDILTKAKPYDLNVDLNNLFKAKIKKIIRLAPNIVEILVYSPLATKNFKPGQFYRLQNYEYFASKINKGTISTSLAMEPLALTGASAYKDEGIISLIVLEMGGSSNLCSLLKEEEPIVLMGPTGTPTEIYSGKKVMLFGGGLGNAVLFSIGKAFKNAGSKVLYFAGYKKQIDRYKTKEIEQASDQIVWCCDETKLDITRKGDLSFHGNIIDAAINYAEGKIGEQKFNLSEIDHIIAIGSAGMMEAVANARDGKLKKYLKEGNTAIASINSSMQCMMKEICAQCLQQHIDPETGVITYVYSCYNQDQCIDVVDFKNLNNRLKQNAVQEKITGKWLNYLMS